jgi:hypothetical protein
MAVALHSRVTAVVPVREVTQDRKINTRMITGMKRTILRMTMITRQGDTPTRIKTMIQNMVKAKARAVWEDSMVVKKILMIMEPRAVMMTIMTNSNNLDNSPAARVTSNIPVADLVVIEGSRDRVHLVVMVEWAMDMVAAVVWVAREVVVPMRDMEKVVEVTRDNVVHSMEAAVQIMEVMKTGMTAEVVHRDAAWAASIVGEKTGMTKIWAETSGAAHKTRDGMVASKVEVKEIAREIMAEWMKAIMVEVIMDREECGVIRVETGTRAEAILDRAAAALDKEVETMVARATETTDRVASSLAETRMDPGMTVTWVAEETGENLVIEVAIPTRGIMVEWAADMAAEARVADIQVMTPAIMEVLPVIAQVPMVIVATQEAAAVLKIQVEVEATRVRLLRQNHAPETIIREQPVLQHVNQGLKVLAAAEVKAHLKENSLIKSVLFQMINRVNNPVDPFYHSLKWELWNHKKSQPQMGPHRQKATAREDRNRYWKNFLLTNYRISIMLNNYC